MTDEHDDWLYTPKRWELAAFFGAMIGFGLMALAILILIANAALAQNQPSNCSGTAGVAAANITFGQQPKQYVTVVNPSAAATLWLSTTGTAAANAAGSFPLVGTGNSATLPPLATVSIIASAGSTPYTCFYR